MNLPAAFADAVKTADPQGAPKLYAFRGAEVNIDWNDPTFVLTTPSTPTTPTFPACLVMFKGQAYDDAKSALGGETFDICADDWSPQFDKLSTSVTALVRNRFELKTTGFQSVTGVEIDGKALPASAYTVEGQVVTVAEGQIPAGAASVKIRVKK